MESKLIRITTFIALLIVASCIYVNTFWGNLDINILPFIEINQLLLYALEPIVDRALPSIFIAIIGMILFSSFFPFAGYKKLKEEGKITKSDKISRILIIIFFFILPIVIVIYLYFINRISFYGFLPVVVIPFSVFLINFLVKHNLVLPNNFDSTIITLMVFILTLSYSLGKIDSSDIKSNQKFKYSQINNDYYKFLGKAGSYFIFLSLDNKTEKLCNTSKFETLDIFEFNRNQLSQIDSIIISKIEKIEIENKKLNIR